MEITDIISLVVVGIVFIGKAIWSAKSKSADSNSEYSEDFSADSQPQQSFTWEELFGDIRNSGVQNVPVGKVYFPENESGNSNVPDVQNTAGDNGNVSSSSCAEEADTVQIDDSEESEKIDWVSVIRNNRAEAVVLSEILAPPHSLR